MKTELMTITPEQAKFILSNQNNNNRKLRLSWVKSLSIMIERNEWLVTHQGIAIDQNHNLQDGQHRLHAIVMANKPVQIMVTTGADPKNFQAIDIQSKRLISDVTNLTKKDAEVSRYIAQKYYRMIQVTPGQVLSISNCGITDIHSELIEGCKSNTKVIGSAPMRSVACLMIKDGHDAEYVKSVFKKLTLYQYTHLSEIEASFKRQIDNGTIRADGGSSSGVLWAVGKKLFDKKFQDKALRIYREDEINANKYANEVLAKFLEAKKFF